MDAEPAVGIREAEVLGLLTRLVEKSLVLYEENGQGNSRYRLLETVRQYATNRLEETGRDAEARRRHLEYFVRLAEEAEPNLGGAGAGLWLERLEADQSNFQSALEWSRCAHGRAEMGLRLCGPLWMFWDTRGYYEEGWGLLTAVLSCPDAQQPTRARANSLNGASCLARRRGDFAAAHALQEEALAIRREIGDLPGTASSLHNLGNVAYDLGEHQVARRRYLEALTINRDLCRTAQVALNLNALGNVAYEEGDLEESRRLKEEACRLAEVSGSIGTLPYALQGLGLIASQQGDFKGARSYFTRALGVCRDLGDRLNIAYLLEHLGEVAERAACWDRVARLCGAADSLRDTLGAPRPPIHLSACEQRLDAARAALGAERFSTGLAEGSAMTLEQAIEYALSEERSEE